MICKKCSKKLFRVPRHPLQRLLPGSRRFACPDCGRKYLIFLDLVCQYCNHALQLIPRQNWQRLIPCSSKHECTQCGHRFIQICGLLISLPFSPKQLMAKRFQSQLGQLPAQRADLTKPAPIEDDPQHLQTTQSVADDPYGHASHQCSIDCSEPKAALEEFLATAERPRIVARRQRLQMLKRRLG